MAGSTLIPAACAIVDAPAPMRWRIDARAIVLCTVIAAFFLLLALAAPHNRDESQYVAAAALTARGDLIFRDFLSLQTPLHAWIYAPVAAVFPGYAFVALRCATALTALATLATVYLTQRRIGVSPGSAALATLLLASTAAFQFTASVVRNDMLPILLTALALWLTAARRIGWAGVLLGLAISAKLSFLPVALAPLFALIREPRSAVRHSLGLAAGLLPTAAAAALAPLPFWEGVFEYGTKAPFQWYAANGLGASLGVPAKLLASLKALAIGPALPAALLLGWSWRLRTDAFTRSATAMAVGGLVGVLLPTPTHIQYAAPVLAPLFVLLGPILTRVRLLAPRPARIVATILIAFALAGTVRSIKVVAKAATHGAPALTLTRTAHDIGARLAANRRAGPIATLSPDRVVDAGRPLDPRFSTGPFVFRSGSIMSAGLVKSVPVVIPANLAAALDRDPPAAILTGYEGPTRRFRLSPDRPLADYARRRSWRPEPLADGHGVLWLPPAGRD